MLSFSQYLSENFKNFIGPQSEEQRKEWVDRVWTVLQKSYAPIGGIKGSGFSSKEDMIKNIPFWKIFVRGEKVLAVFMYKDTNGRKSVAIGSDGSDEAKKVVASVYKADLKTSYGEKSGPALGFAIKSIDPDYLENFFLRPEEVEKLTGHTCVPVARFGVENLEPADRKTWEKYPKLRPYFYVRELSGHYYMKASMGTPGLKILG